MRRATAFFCAALLTAAACKRAGSPRSLLRAYDNVARSPLCSQNLPSDWVSTWPVPTGKPGEFVILFYALDRIALDASGVPRLRVTEPRGKAVFTADGKVSACDSQPVDLKPLEGERYGQEAMELDEEGFDKATRKLISLTAAVADAYARRASPDKKLAADYWTQFKRLAEPPLRGDYYRANPDFWEWLRRENGQSLLPPKM